MLVKNLVGLEGFTLINEGDLNKQLETPYCCDLLSHVMSKDLKNAAWITVIANINTLAVVTLANAACLVLAEGVTLDTIAVERANIEHITVFSTELTIFEAAIEIYKSIHIV